MKNSCFPLLLIGGLFITACKEEIPDSISNINASEITFSEQDATAEATVTLTLEGVISKPVTVNYQWQENSAVMNDDFMASNGSLEFEPDRLSLPLSFQIVGDTHLELDESFDLLLTVDGQQFIINFFIKDNDQIEAILSDADGFYTPESYPSMKLAWADEFNGSQLNTGDWTYELGDGCDKGICGWGNNELQNYTNEEANLKFENGRMVITAIKDGSGNYTSARIITQDKVELRFGRIDIRAKMPIGQGLWPALWMLGANIDDVGWPVCGEIDIMELVGHQPATTHGTVHYDNNGYTTSSSSRTLGSGDFSDQFHVFSLIWERDRIRWYLDNKLFKTLNKGDNGYPFNNAFFFIMNVAVGGNWPGNPDSSTVFPQTMEVDYIRVFQ